MAGSAAKLFIQVGADVSNAAKGLSSIDKQLKGLGRTASSLRNIAISATAILVVRKTVTELNSLAQASAGEVAGQVRLQQAIKNTGQAIDANVVGPLEDWISTQERLTGIADNDIRDALTNLVLETGNLAEAQDRLTIAEDASAATGQDVVSMAKLIGKADEDSIGQLTKLGLIRGDYAAKTVGGFDEIAAAQQLARNSGLQYAQALKVVQDGGQAGESVMKKYGVATKDMFGDAQQGAIDVKGALNELRANVKGSAAAVNDSPAGQWAAARNELDHLGKDLGSFVLPMWSKFIHFATRGVTGIRRLFALFTTDISGPKLGSARKTWKQVFGSDMPDALGVVVDWLDKMGGRFQTFVDDLNSEDPDKVRGAIKKFASGVKDDAVAALGDLGKAMDDLGPAGTIAKLALIGIGASVPLGPTLELAGNLLSIGASGSIIAANFAKIPAPALAVMAAFASVADAAYAVWQTIDLIRNNWDKFVIAVRNGDITKLLRDDTPYLGPLGTAVNLFLDLAEAVHAAADWLVWLWGRLGDVIDQIPLLGGLKQAFQGVVGGGGSGAAGNGGFGGGVNDIFKGTNPFVGSSNGIPVTKETADLLRQFGGAFTPYAEGGIAMRPHLGMVGEAGPEAMIPLDKFDWSQIGGRGGGGDRAIEINIHGDVYGEDGEARIRRGVARGMRLAAG